MFEWCEIHWQKNLVFAEVLAAHVAKTRFIDATITNGANALNDAYTV